MHLFTLMACLILNSIVVFSSSFGCQLNESPSGYLPSLESTFEDMQSLMGLYDQGDVAAAYPLAKRIFEKRNKTLGRNHPLTWTSFVVYRDICKDSRNQLPNNLDMFSYIESKASRDPSQLERLQSELRNLSDIYSKRHSDYLLLLIFQSKVSFYQGNVSPVKDEPATIREKFDSQNVIWKSQKLAEIEEALKLEGLSSYLSYQMFWVAANLADTVEKEENYWAKLLASKYLKLVSKSGGFRETAIRKLVDLFAKQERLQDALDLVRKMKSRSTSERHVKLTYGKALAHAKKIAKAKKVLLELLRDDLKSLKPSPLHHYKDYAILDLLLDEKEIDQFDQVIAEIEEAYEKTFGLESQEAMQCQVNVLRILVIGIEAASRSHQNEMEQSLNRRLSNRKLLRHKALLNLDNDLLRTNSFIVLCSHFILKGDTEFTFRLIDNYRKRIEEIYGLESREYGSAQCSAAFCLIGAGERASNSASEIFVTAALDLDRRFGGLSPRDKLRANEALGIRFAEVGRYDEAKPLLEEVVKTYLEYDNNTTYSRRKHIEAQLALGRTYNSLGLYEKAIVNCQLLISRYKDLSDLQTRNSCIASARCPIGIAYRGSGDQDSARMNLQSALRLMDQFGHKKVGEKELVLIALANLNEKHGNLEGAIGMYQRCIEESKLWRDAVRGNILAGVGVEGRVASLMIGRREPTEVLSMFDKSIKSVTEIAGMQTDLMSKENQIKFLKHIDLQQQIKDAIRFAVSVPSRNANQLSLEWLVNSKSFATRLWGKQLGALRNRLQNDGLERLLKVRGEIATLALTSVAKSVLQLQLRYLLEQEDALFKNSIAKSRPTMASSWKDFDAIRECLGPKQVYLDFFKTTIKNKERIESAYAVWIVAPNKDFVEVVVLSEADKIDSLINVVRRGISSHTSLSTQNANNGFAKDLRNLSKRLLHPITRHLKGVEQIVLCPDEHLWLLPWAVLKLPDSGKFLIEDVQIRFVANGADMTAAKQSIGYGRPVVFANPDYNSPISVRSVVPAKLVGENSSRMLNRLLAKVRPLPITEAEAKAVVPSLRQYSGANPIEFFGESATERAAKSVRRPKAIVFSTHGFFLEQKDRAIRGDTAGLMNLSQTSFSEFVFDNPLLRCGLLLAGSNCEVSPGYDDGVLTGLEIAGMDLRGTGLAVLSACDTGVGDVQNGQGVAGLRQAFQLAGAESVLASLWQVDDAETARLMNLFFDNLANGMTKSQALRQAQLTRIKARRARHGVAHPFFWAAFTLTGKD